MSILTNLLEGKITWGQAVTQIESDIASVASKSQAGALVLSGLESIVKQGASDAITIGQTAAADYLGPLSKAAELALDAALTTATKGIATPFTPLVNSGIDQIVNFAQAEINAWSLKAKAALTAVPTPSAP